MNKLPVGNGNDLDWDSDELYEKHIKNQKLGRPRKCDQIKKEQKKKSNDDIFKVLEIVYFAGKIGADKDKTYQFALAALEAINKKEKK